MRRVKRHVRYINGKRRYVESYQRKNHTTVVKGWLGKTEMTLIAFILIVVSLGYWAKNTYDVGYGTRPYKHAVINMTPVKVITEEFKYQDIIVKIRTLESSLGTKGLAVSCKARGMVNDVGYRGQEGFCFTDESSELQTVTKWFADKFSKGLSIAQATCLYNEGKIENTCKYYENYKSI